MAREPRLELRTQQSKCCVIPISPFPNVWWVLLDLNQRTPKRPDLQSGGFSHSPKHPYKTAVVVRTIIELLQTTPRVLHIHMICGKWWTRWESNPHELFTPRILSPVRLPVPPLVHILSTHQPVMCVPFILLLLFLFKGALQIRP